MSEVQFWRQEPGRGTYTDDETDVPRDVLEDAAEQLEQQTKGQVIAEIRDVEEGDQLRLDFWLIAMPVRYRYLLLSLRHRLGGFPVALHAGENTIAKCSSREELVAALIDFLQSEATDRLIHSLRKLSHDK